MSHTSTSIGAPVRALSVCLVVSLAFACNSGTLAEGGNYPSPQGNATRYDSNAATQSISAIAPVDAGSGDDCDLGVWCPPPPDTGCGPGVVCPDAGSEVDAGTDAGVEVTVENFGARGEFTSPSFLTTAPPGAALVAQNVVVDAVGEYTTARGFERLPTGIPGDWEIDAWTVYQGGIVAHVAEVSTLYRYVSGTWTAYSGTYDAPSPGVDANGDTIPGQVKFFETQQALYFSTASGMYRLEGVTETPTLAGVVQALPGVVNPSAAGQALSTDSATAYRYVWGRRATNGRIMLGAPSSRVTITNRSEEFTFNPSAMVKAGGVVTVSTTAGVVGNLVVGQSITLANVDAADVAAFPEETEIITSIDTSTNTFTYAQAGADFTATDPGAASITTTATAIDVAHVIPFPDGVDSTFFLQVYRSDEVPTNTTPSDEMFLVHEEAVTDMASQFGVSSMYRAANVVRVNMGEPHGLSVGESITLTSQFGVPADAANFPPGTKTVTSIIDAYRFEYAETGASVTLAGSAIFMWYPDYTFVDGTPDALKGDALYTNANAGGSIGTAHYVPPKAAVTTLFSNRAVYANVEMPERLALTILAVGPGGLDVGMGFSISLDASVLTGTTYTAGTAESGTTFEVFTDGTPAQNVANTVASIVRVINDTKGGLAYARSEASSNSLNVGQFIIESRTPASPVLRVTAQQDSPFIVPAIPYEVPVVSGTMERATDETTVQTTPSRPHGFVIGQTVYRDATSTVNPDFPEGEYVVTGIVDENTFIISDPGTDAVASIGSYRFLSTAQPVRTDDDAAPGGFMVSDLANPDSVPAVIPEIVGDRYKRILRMIQVGGSLFFLKEDGLYRLNGTDPTNYTVDCVDSTIRFVAPRASWVLNGRAYALTTQGLASWTESGNPEPAALQIEDQFRAIVETAPLEVERYAFAVAHESKRRAYLWLPSASGVGAADTVKVYNATNDAWTRWTKPAVDAFVHPTEDRLYVVNPDADGSGTSPAPSRERNTGTGADYQDEDGNAIEALVTWLPTVPPEANLQQQLVRTSYRFKDTVPTEVDVGYSTPWVPDPLWFTLTPEYSTSPGVLTTPPDQDHSRGDSHTLSIRHAVVGEAMRLLGWSGQYRYWTRAIP